jgi:hypothetical protein
VVARASAAIRARVSAMIFRPCARCLPHLRQITAHSLPILTESLAKLSDRDGDVRSCSFPHLGPAPFTVNLETNARLSSAIGCSQWAIFGNDDATRQV